MKTKQQKQHEALQRLYQQLRDTEKYYEKYHGGYILKPNAVIRIERDIAALQRKLGITTASTA